MIRRQSQSPFLFLAVAGLFAFALLLPGCEKSKITVENFEKIKLGMTADEVRGILGTTYSNETANPLRKVTNTGVAGSQTKPEVTYVWKNKEKGFSIIVVFGDDGKVVEHRKVEN